MSLARNITRGTVLVNSSRMPDPLDSTKSIANWGEAAGQFFFGFGNAVGGVGNIVGAVTQGEVGRQAITAAERQAELDRAAKAQRQQQVLKFLGGTVVTVGIIAILIAIIR